MPIVEIPGVGNVEFPDTMRPEEVKAAAGKLSKRGAAKPKAGADPFSVPRAPYSGAPELPVEALGWNDPRDPINWLPMLFGGGAGALGAKAGAGAARNAVTSGAATPLLRHVGTAGGASVGAMLGGPGGAALGGLVGRQVLSPATISKLLGGLARSRVAPAPAVSDDLIRVIGPTVRHIQ